MRIVRHCFATSVLLMAGCGATPPQATEGAVRDVAVVGKTCGGVAACQAEAADAKVMKTGEC